MVSIKKQANSFCTYYFMEDKVTRHSRLFGYIAGGRLYKNGAWYMFLYGGEYIPFAVIIGIYGYLLAFTIYNIVKIGHNDVYSYMNKLKGR